MAPTQSAIATHAIKLALTTAIKSSREPETQPIHHHSSAICRWNCETFVTDGRSLTYVRFDYKVIKF